MTYAIQTHSLSFSFHHGKRVVDDLSLEVPNNCIYGFLGPNGAGKTTTIRLLTGMLLSDTDNIRILGQSLQKNIPGIFNSMGTLIETPSLYAHLTAKENLAIICTLHHISKKRIDEVLSVVRLSKVGNKKVKEFSLGMKQRLAVAMALLPDPELLILDEPANGLDPQGIIEVRELLMELHSSQGKTIFVSSHLLHEIEKTCTHIGIIQAGRLLYQGTLDDMRQQAHTSGEVVFKVANASDYIDRIQNEYVQAKQIAGDEILLPFTEREQVTLINRQLVASNIPVYGIQVRGGLEDWFIQLTKKEKQII